MAVFLVLLVAFPNPGDPPLPSIGVVQEALRKNADRLKNRKVKFVTISRAGPPTAEFPPVDAPDRGEAERTDAADGRRRGSFTIFRNGAFDQRQERAFDGAAATVIYPPQRVGAAREAVISRTPPSSFGLDHIDGLWKDLAESLSARSTLAWDDGNLRLLRLRPYGDDPGPWPIRNTHLLDPNKNYWPVASIVEGKNAKREWYARERRRVVEFFEGPGPVYPKRVTDWMLTTDAADGPSRTSYYTVVAAEFPARFVEAEFRVTIPDGTAVRDERVGKNYVQGAPPTPVPPPPTRLETVRADAAYALKNLTFDDCVFYGGFVVGAAAVAVVGFFGFRRRDGKTPKGRS